MTKSNENKPAFSAKAAADAWIKARNAAAKKSILAKVVAKSKVPNAKKRWASLAKDMEANNKARIKARATGDWKAVNAARPVTPKKAAKPKVAPVEVAISSEGVTAVDAAKALAALVASNEAASPEAAALVAFINSRS